MHQLLLRSQQANLECSRIRLLKETKKIQENCRSVEVFVPNPHGSPWITMDHHGISWDHISLFQRSPDSLPAVNSRRPEMITSFDRIQQDQFKWVSSIWSIFLVFFHLGFVCFPVLSVFLLICSILELEVAISTIFATLSYQFLGFTQKKPGCNGNACRDATGVKLRTQFPNLSEPDAAFPGVEISTDLGSTFFCCPTRYH